MDWDPFNVATDGMFCDAFGMATDGYFCARRPVVTSFPPVRAGLDRRDLRDIADIIAILSALDI